MPPGCQAQLAQRLGRRAEDANVLADPLQPTRPSTVDLSTEPFRADSEQVCKNGQGDFGSLRHAPFSGKR